MNGWDPRDNENWKHDDNPNDNSCLGLVWAAAFALCGIVLALTWVGLSAWGG